MRTRLVAIAIVAVVVLISALPASAQTMFQLRYWSTTGSWDYVPTGGGPVGSYPSSSNLWGFTLRRPSADGVWAVSFNFDSGSRTDETLVLYVPDISRASNRFWNLNLHRQFTSSAGLFSVFAGWGSAAVEYTPNDWYVRQSGFRVGLDGTVPLKDGWYVTGSLGYMLRGDGSHHWPEWNGTIKSSLVNWHAGIGRNIGAWGIEGGYRNTRWDLSGFPFPVTMVLSWSGWYAGLNFTAP